MGDSTLAATLDVSELAKRDEQKLKATNLSKPILNRFKLALGDLVLSLGEIPYAAKL